VISLTLADVVLRLAARPTWVYGGPVTSETPGKPSSEQGELELLVKSITS